MPRDFNRSERVAGQVRRDLARLIQAEIDDPKVGFISISDVEVSRDIAHATVWVTVFEPEKAGPTLEALQKAAGFLRRRLGQVMRIRAVPELHFQHDASVETGQRMDELIDRAIAADHPHDGAEDSAAEGAEEAGERNRTGDQPGEPEGAQPGTGLSGRTRH